MKKTALLVCAVILLVCSLCGCVNLPGKNPGGDKTPDGGAYYFVFCRAYG